MKKNSLNVEIWKYFLIFSILILGFLWTFQVLFLNKYYKHVKIKDIKSVAQTIKTNQSSDNFSKIVNTASFDKSVCVEVIDKSFFSVYTSSFLGKGCFSGKEEQAHYKTEFIESNVDSATYELINPKFNNETLVYAIKLDNEKYAFINTSLDPIDSTVNIIRNQLIIVTIIVLVLSFIIAYFISNYISNPIVKINKAAKKMAKGEFDIKFEAGNNILELNELADTLNHTSEELSKTEELRRDLMANVSHDLKTPLTMIKAYAEMSRDLHSKSKKKREEDMNIIIDEVDRLTILVNDILDLSKMQSNINELKYEEFDLIKLIDDILQKYKILQETENYNFEFIHNRDKVIIKADYEKLRQVIYNLINNAINYTGSDNKVTVKVTVNEEILVEVIDTGKGIKEEDLPYIWDKYYKNKKKHRRNLVGTGLGLSIVKNILVRHQFKYGVKSELNKGSNFFFVIPIK